MWYHESLSENIKMTGTRAPTKVPVPVIIPHGHGKPHVHSITMITVLTKNFNNLSQEKYDEVVERLQFHQITCTCGHCGCMRKYGRYKRSVWIFCYEIVLRIQRLQCTSCGKTHAILLDILIPYSRIPLEDCREIILAGETGKSCTAVQEANPYIEDGMVLHVRIQFRKHWQQKLLSENISLQENLIADCFRFFGRQFMQIRGTPNILFSPST